MEQPSSEYAAVRNQAVQAQETSKWESAVERWLLVVLLPEATETDFIFCGEAAIAARYFDEASGALFVGVRRFPGNVWIGRLWCLLPKYQRDFQEAARRFGIVRENCDADFLAADHGECLSITGRFEEAETVLRKAIRDYPTSRWVNLAWVRVAVHQRMPDEVVRRWSEVEMRIPIISEAGTDKHLLSQKVQSLLGVGAYDAAAAPIDLLRSLGEHEASDSLPAVTGFVLMREPLIIVSAVYSFDDVVRPIMAFHGSSAAKVFFFFGSNMSLLFHHELRERLPRQFHALSTEFDRAHITFMANEVDELLLAKSLGMRAVLVNNNAFVDEEQYIILSDAEKKFDAIYNARFMPYKRHHLASKVENLRLVMAGPKLTEIDGREIDVRTMFPNTEINAEEMNTREVVMALNSARCGLCLSAAEGAMYAAMEYLLCGLPVVTTWNLGGRDWWLSGDYAIWCDPDAEAVAQGVRTMLSRDIAPSHVRETALQRIYRERTHFFATVTQTLAEHGIFGLDIEDGFMRNFSDKANYVPRPLSYFVAE